MSMFKRNHKHHIPSLATYTLPDMIFIFLVFFLLMTNFHSMKLKSSFTRQNRSELLCLERKTLVTVISVVPTDHDMTEDRILINDSYATVSDIHHYIICERAGLNAADRKKMVVLLKIDKNTRMGIVSDIKQALRDAGIKKIAYKL